MRIKTGWHKNESGSVMVEFALVAMILILLFAGIIQFGLVFNTLLVLEDVARNTARTAAISAIPDDQIILNAINAVSIITLNSSDFIITPALRSRGQMLNVTITYQYHLPVTFGLLPEKYTLTAQASMLSEI